MTLQKDMRAFVSRQDCLNKRLKEFCDNKSYPDFGYNESWTLAELQELLREAEALFEVYEEFDGGLDLWCNKILQLREERRLAGLPIEPTPSWIKCWAWNHLFEARTLLADAYHSFKEYESALPLYRKLVDQALRMRMEIWDENVKALDMMTRLGTCYYTTRHYESAREWYEKAMQFCESEKTDGAVLVKQLLRENLAKMAGSSKVGPPLLAAADDGNSNNKHWKLCWWCGATQNENKELKLSRCTKCINHKLATPAYYCSKKCQEEDWRLRHKEYHRNIKEQQEEMSEKVSALFTESEQSAFEKQQEDECCQLLLLADEAHRVEKNSKKARHLLERCVKLSPSNPIVYKAVAALFCQCYNIDGAIAADLEVMRLADDERIEWPAGSDREYDWSYAALSIFSACSNDPAAASLLNCRPVWILVLEEQLKVGKRACKGAPNLYGCRIICADALEKLGLLDQAIEHLSVARELAEEQGEKDFANGLFENIEQLRKEGEEEGAKMNLEEE